MSDLSAQGRVHDVQAWPSSAQPVSHCEAAPGILREPRPACMPSASQSKPASLHRGDAESSEVELNMVGYQSMASRRSTYCAAIPSGAASLWDLQISRSAGSGSPQLAEHLAVRRGDAESNEAELDVVAFEEEDLDGEEENFDPYAFIKTLPPLSQCTAPWRHQLLPRQTRWACCCLQPGSARHTCPCRPALPVSQLLLANATPSCASALHKPHT